MNHRKQIITVYLFAVSLILLYGHSIRAAEGPGPQRVVSLAPSVTETLFALGFGDRLVGGDHLLRLSSRGAADAEDRRVYQSECGSDHRDRPELVIGVSELQPIR